MSDYDGVERRREWEALTGVKALTPCDHEWRACRKCGKCGLVDDYSERWPYADKTFVDLTPAIPKSLSTDDD